MEMKQYFVNYQRGPLSLAEERLGLALIGQELHNVAAPALLCPSSGLWVPWDVSLWHKVTGVATL